MPRFLKALLLWWIMGATLVGCQANTVAQTPGWMPTVAAQSTALAQQRATVAAQSTQLAAQGTQLAAQYTALQTETAASVPRTAALGATPTLQPTATRLLPTPAPSATASALPTPQATATPGVTPTPVTAGAGRAQVSVPVNTLCRIGPGTAFYRVGVVQAGQWVSALGRWREYWRVQLPDGSKCWIWGPQATVRPHTAQVPTVRPGVGVLWGYVFTDTNGDGRYQPGVDARKGGLTVSLYPANGGVCLSSGEPLATTRVNGRGFYTFTLTVRKPATAYCVQTTFLDPTETVCRDTRVVGVQAGEATQADLYTVPSGPCPVP